MKNLSARVPACLALLAAIAGIIYLVKKSVLYSQVAVDFPYIWLAGKLWLDGVNPYSPAFEAAGKVLVEIGHSPQVWFYPPNWWPLSTLLASIPLFDSLMLWRGISAALLLAGTAILTWARSRWDGSVTLTRAAATVAFACLMSATPTALALGQTSLLIYAGVALFFVALFTGHRAVMTAALVLTMLKPQIGLPLACFLLPTVRWWPALGAAALLSIVASLPAFSLSGPTDLVSAYIAQLSIHENLDPNHPLEMTGLRILAFESTGIALSGLMLMLLSGIAAAGLGWYRRKTAKPDPLTFACLLLLVNLISPLHTYDMMMIAPVILLSSRFGLIPQALVFAGLALIFRANNLAEVTGFYDAGSVLFIDSRIATIGILVVALGVIVEAAGAWRSPTADVRGIEKEMAGP